MIFSDFVDLLGRNRRLILIMTRRELVDRYAGQIIGPFWALIHPLTLVLVYAIIFGWVFKARIDLPDAPSSYPAYLMSGLFAWLAVVDSTVRSSGAISGNSSLVKQIVFPTEVLVIRCVLAAAINQATAVFLAVLYITVATGQFPIFTIMLPFIFAIQIVFMLGLSYVCATVGVFIRDTKDIIQSVSAFGVYMAPIVFLPDWLPKFAQIAILLNPFTHMVRVFQDALFFDNITHPASWVIFPAIAISSFAIGRSLFKRFEHGFTNRM